MLPGASFEAESAGASLNQLMGLIRISWGTNSALNQSFHWFNWPGTSLCVEEYKVKDVYYCYMHATTGSLDCVRIDFKNHDWFLLLILIYVAFSFYMPSELITLREKWKAFVGSNKAGQPACLGEATVLHPIAH